MNRRAFLRGTGTLTLLAVGGGVFYARERGAFRVGEGPAYAPWHDWDTDAVAGPLAVVRAGILAASPHNTQPWLFEVGAAHIKLYADPGRALGALDPYAREQYLGLGCALENMVLAGRAHGYTCQITPVLGVLTSTPTGAAGPVLVATLHLELGPAAAPPSALYAAIPHRHTHRGPYDPARPVHDATLQQLRALAAQDLGPAHLHLLTAAPDQAAFAIHTLAATRAIVADAAMSAAGHRWFRLTTQASEQYCDGVTLEGVGLSPLTLCLAKLLPGVSAAESDAIWLRNTAEQQLPTAAVFGLLTVPDRHDRAQALAAGRLWQRLHLQATALGLAAQPLNQLVETADREAQLGRPPQAANQLAQLLPPGAGQATFSFRLGYAARPAAAVPRRPLAQVLLKQGTRPPEPGVSDV